MQATADRIFLDFSAKKLEQFLSRIKDCVGRLNQEQIWRRAGDSDNAVGNLLLHLAGNVRQWILSGIGGKPDVRVRDREFSARGDIEAAELMERLEGTIQDAIGLIKALPPERLLEMTTVQNYTLPKMEAIYHVVEHFAQHTGQIIFATKLLTGEDLGYYKHLSQPKRHEATP